MRSLVRTILVLVLSSFALTPAMALAKEPATWSKVDVAVHAEQNGTLMIVSGELPDSASLPAEVKLAAPAGSTFQWAGEILGGDVSQDPDVRYEVSTKGDSDVYSFTLTKSRTGQLEVFAPTAASQSATGGSADFSWTAPSAADKVVLSVRVPQTAKLTGEVEGLTSVPGPTGYAYLQREIDNVKPGQTESLKLAYTASPAPPAGASKPVPASETSPVLYVVLALVAGAFVLLGSAVWRKMSGKTTGAEAQVRTAPTRVAAERTASSNAGDTAADDTADGEPAAGRTPLRPKTIAVGLVVGALLVGGVFAVLGGGSATQVGDTLTMQYAQVDACTVTNLVLTPPAGAELSKDAEKIMSALRTVPGVGRSTVHLKESRLQVDYCESSASEEQLVAAVEGTGYKIASVSTGPAGSE